MRVWELRCVERWTEKRVVTYRVDADSPKAALELIGSGEPYSLEEDGIDAEYVETLGIEIEEVCR